MTPEEQRLQTESVRRLNELWEHRKRGMELERELRELRQRCNHGRWSSNERLWVKVCCVCQMEVNLI